MKHNVKEMFKNAMNKYNFTSYDNDEQIFTYEDDEKSIEITLMSESEVYVRYAYSEMFDRTVERFITTYFDCLDFLDCEM